MNFDFLLESLSYEELKQAIKQHILDNKDTELERHKDSILKLIDQGKYKKLLHVKDTKYIYRFIDFKDMEFLGKITNKQGLSEEPGVVHKLSKGVLKPKKDISSWTSNPRSLIYSGYLSVLKPNISLVLFRAKVNNSKNIFFGNPDDMAKEVDTDNGYFYEKEVIGSGDIVYDKAVYQIHQKQLGIEALALNLINSLIDYKKIKYEGDYYA
jgi:hypothetical protein